jgi:hypothetical protein
MVEQTLGAVELVTKLRAAFDGARQVLAISALVALLTVAAKN